ncbi:hypothetical protein M758_7G144000 [Ceratodon purpureus]|nr:hypothetical protein M758_7G144000 [Ceratodon purpureus]
MRQTMNCAWYVNYPSDVGLQCLAYLWAGVLDEAGQNRLLAYTYYHCDDYTAICWDDVWHSDYCNIGCFYLSNSSFAIPPISVPPPVAPTPPSSNGGTMPGTPPGTNTAPRLRTGAFQQADVLLVFCTAMAIVATANIFNLC